MVAQTTIDGAPRPTTVAARATRSASAVLRDVWTLADLQCQLTAADFREGRRRAVTAVAAGAIGLVILLAATPIALIALAELLVLKAELSPPAAYGLATLAGVVVAAGALLLGWAKIKQAFNSFSRSREELDRNLTALRCLVSSCEP